MTSDAVNEHQPTAPETGAPSGTGERGGQVSEGPSGFGTAETAVGGADSVPDDPDVNTQQQPGSGPGTGDGPGAGLSAPENNG
jgi:hypothetical protein